MEYPSFFMLVHVVYNTMPDAMAICSTMIFLPRTIDGVGTCWYACRDGRCPLGRKV